MEEALKYSRLFSPLMGDKAFEEAQRKARMLGYLEKYLSRHHDSYAQCIAAKLEKLNLEKSPYQLARDLDTLYTAVRAQERKVPSLDLHEERDKTSQTFPSLSLQQPVADALSLRRHGALTTAFLDKISIVSYSPHFQDHIGRKADLREQDLQGRLFFNTDFFHMFDTPKTEGKSQMRNIAKSFFTAHGQNYVCLVQYLPAHSRSAEHYHTLDETILQLAGRSFLELRPVTDDTQREAIELSPGSLHHIPPAHLHVVRTYQEGSITLPVKQTLSGKKDHLYISMSAARIQQEFDAFFSCHYNSGQELLTALQDYTADLDRFEKQRFQSVLKARLQQEQNPNFLQILEQLQASL